ncbi:Pre-mRNA-splicing factor CWC2 [Meredithblackwellia eburnea MCA 4105]
MQQDTQQQQQEQPVIKKKKLVKRKPARKQVEPGQIEKKAPEQTGQTFNVWYHKWAGGDKYDSYNVKEKSQSRVNISKDAGYTRADGGDNPYICLFFARGCCPYGSECSFLHRLPPDQAKLPDASLDVFGREKHSDYRDDMGGVGSFNRQNRTLYVGKIKENRNTAETIERHFEEFGDIERIKILQSRGVAFVTYVSELNAQFAKEAMMCQSLDEDEVINVRWATEDPNPAAKRAEHKYLVKKGEEGIARALDPAFVQSVREMDELDGLVEPRKFDPDSEDYSGDVRSSKRARIEQPPPPTSSSTRDAVESTTQDSTVATVPAPPPPEPTKPMGLLSANAIDSLKFMASLRQSASPTASIAPPKPAAAVSGLGGLADYGSDDEDD